MSKSFTNAEIGALLIAVGEQMNCNDLLFGAALDGASTEEMKRSIHYRLTGYDDYDAVTAGEVADRLLKLTETQLLEQIGGLS